MKLWVLNSVCLGFANQINFKTIKIIHLSYLVILDSQDFCFASIWENPGSDIIFVILKNSWDRSKILQEPFE